MAARLAVDTDTPYMLVLVGAGASYDCDDLEQKSGDRLPLVKDLFKWNNVLNEYKRVRTMAPALRTATSGDRPTESVEEYLRRILMSGKEFEQAQAREVPLYLQDRIARLSDDWENYSGDYAILVNEILAACKYTAFVSLNYDLLLDSHLPKTIKAVGDYVHREGVLVKPHGSVNWADPLEDGLPSKYDELTIREVVDQLGSDIRDWYSRGRHPYLLGDGYTSLHSRTIKNNETLLFPRIAVPLGAEEDEVLCPQGHLDALIDFLRKYPINMLVIGYSGLDHKVLEVIRDANPTIRSLTVVNKNPDDGSSNPTADSAKAIGKTLGFSEDQIDRGNNRGFRQYVLGQTFRDLLAKIPSS